MRPGGLSKELDELGRAGLSAALDAGEAILAAGGSALDDDGVHRIHRC